jgi:hypothetical protein
MCHECDGNGSGENDGKYAKYDELEQKHEKSQMYRVNRAKKVFVTVKSEKKNKTKQ